MMNEDHIREALFVDRASFVAEKNVEPFVALQRVVVRMLFDGAFVERVYSVPHEILEPLGVDEKLIAQLVSNDKRLWQADRLRRLRALKILMEEFKVSTTLALAECRSLKRLDAFFSSPRFHDAVQTRGYMALAFSQYIQDLCLDGTLQSLATKCVLELESGMATSRRLLREKKRGVNVVSRFDDSLARYVNATGVLGCLLPRGVIAIIQHIEKYLFETSLVPALALCDDVPRPDPLPDLEIEHGQGFLLEPKDSGQVEMSEVPEAFCHVLHQCREPKTLEEIRAFVSSKGVDKDRTEGLVEALKDAGVIEEIG